MISNKDIWDWNSNVHKPTLHFFSFAWIKQVHHGDYSTESIPQHGNLLFTSREKKKGNKIRQLSFQASDNNNKDETKAQTFWFHAYSQLWSMWPFLSTKHMDFEQSTLFFQVFISFWEVIYLLD